MPGTSTQQGLASGFLLHKTGNTNLAIAINKVLNFKVIGLMIYTIGGLGLIGSMMDEHGTWIKRFREKWENSLLHNETFSFDLSSPIKLSVTETGVVWSWANFSHSHTVDILAKQYYPVFFLHGCQDKEEFSSVKIINSKVGKN